MGREREVRKTAGNITNCSIKKKTLSITNNNNIRRIASAQSTTSSSSTASRAELGLYPLGTNRGARHSKRKEHTENGNIT